MEAPIKIPRVFEIISRLFSEDIDLLDGFNIFLPAGYHIERSIGNTTTTASLMTPMGPAMTFTTRRQIEGGHHSFITHIPSIHPKSDHRPNQQPQNESGSTDPGYRGRDTPGSTEDVDTCLPGPSHLERVSKHGDQRTSSPENFTIPANFSELNEIQLQPTLKESATAAQDLDGQCSSGLRQDIGSVADLLTDSGYASVRGDIRPAFKDETGQVLLSTTHDPSQLPIDDSEDASTTYSVAWSVPEEELDTYKLELSEAIHKNICRHVPDPELLKSLTSALPSFLRSFALRLGAPGSSKAEKEVMYFVHKHRKCVQRLPYVPSYVWSLQELIPSQ